MFFQLKCWTYLLYQRPIPAGVVVGGDDGGAGAIAIAVAV